VGRVHRRIAAFLIAVPFVLAGLPACGFGSSGSELTIYSGRGSNLIKPLLEQFAEETGVDIAVRYGQSSDLALLIDEEGKNSPADVFLSQSPGALGFLEGNGRLRSLSGRVLELVEPQFRSGRDTWVGLSGRVRVLVYNTELVDEASLPTSVFDLTNPEHRGDVAVAPANASFQDFVTAMRSLTSDNEALDWLEAMAENDAPVYENNTAIVQAVARGEVPMGLVNHYYNFRQKAEDPGSPTANHVFPNGDVGALLIVSGIGVLDTAGDVEDAERLVSFLLSKRAQRFYSEETFEYPLARDVEAAEGLPALETIATTRFDPNDLAGGFRRTLELIEQSGIAT